jgi:nitrogen fixation protein NifZ
MIVGFATTRQVRHCSKGNNTMPVQERYFSSTAKGQSIMSIKQLQPGDMVFAVNQVKNDGSVPQLAEDAIIADAGARGVLINTGHLEENPDKLLFLVRFENKDAELGPPVVVWEEEISATPPTA